jgi:hypothetical protein
MAMLTWGAIHLHSESVVQIISLHKLLSRLSVIMEFSSFLLFDDNVNNILPSFDTVLN